MRHRFDFIHVYTTFRSFVKTQHSAIIKCFRCDLGGEYTFIAFSELLIFDGTVHQSSCTDTPQQNEVAKRKHRHIVGTARSLLLSAGVPSAFWGKVVLTVVHLINKTPSSHTSCLSPYENLYGHPLDYSSLRVFGCTCFILRPSVECNKLSSHSIICVFLSYGEGQKGYHCYDPVAQQLYISCHVFFLDHIPFFSIPTKCHTLSKSNIICIDHLLDDPPNPMSPTS